MKEKLLRSGIIFTALSFISGVGNLVFLKINGSALGEGEFGAFGQTTAFVGLLGLPLLMASTAIVHHIAHFRAANNEARLQGLLVGCRSFLLKFTIVACVLGIVLIQPLSRLFEIPRPSLTVAALVCLIIALWTGYAAVLAQGMGWFKRLALISFTGVMVKIILVWFITRKYPVAESGVFAVAAGTMLNLAIFFWWRDLFKPGERISPWDRDFFRYLIVAASGVGAQWCFTQSDMLVVGNYFNAADKDDYTRAVKTASGLHLAVSPLLIVLFTARSSERSSKSFSGPLGLLLLYAAGLAGGALVLFLMRDLAVQIIFGRSYPATSAMIPPLAVTMIFVGLIQALGMWMMASNWVKAVLFYGAIGVAYWATLLGVASRAYRAAPIYWGPSLDPVALLKIPGSIPPATLLHIMPVIAGAGFVVMLIAWIAALRARPEPAAA